MPADGAPIHRDAFPLVQEHAMLWYLIQTAGFITGAWWATSANSEGDLGEAASALFRRSAPPAASGREHCLDWEVQIVRPSPLDALALLLLLSGCGKIHMESPYNLANRMIARSAVHQYKCEGREDLQAGSMIRTQPWGLAFALMIVAGLIFGTLIALYKIAGIEPSVFQTDPNSIAPQPFYFGYLSSLGCVLWLSAASIGLFTALSLMTVKERADLQSLGMLAALSLCFGLDDLFMIHEAALRAIGVSEITAYALYAVLALWTAAAVFKSRAFEDLLLLAAAGAALAGSVIADVLADRLTVFAVNAEDGMKFFGILFMFAYLVRRSWAALQRNLS